jgi:hypothetical protein
LRTAGLADEAHAEEGSDSNDGRLECVHKELLLGGGDAGVLGHEGHVVGYGREADLAEETHAQHEEGATLGGAFVEELAVVVPVQGREGCWCLEGGGIGVCTRVHCRYRRS